MPMSMNEMVMPKMGESIFEATIIRWLKKEGDKVEKDESILEVATDKVDTEVPATMAGFLTKILFKEGEVVKVGITLAHISSENTNLLTPAIEELVINEPKAVSVIENQINQISQNYSSGISSEEINRFYSPLVLNIAKKEQISISELENIAGTGAENRVTKNDIINYLNIKKTKQIFYQDNLVEKIKIKEPELENTNNDTFVEKVKVSEVQTEKRAFEPVFTPQPNSISEKNQPQFNGNFEVIEMDRMRKIIAQRMLESQKISATVTSWVEADVTNMVQWRGKIKNEFMKREGEVITFTPVFIEAIAKSLKDYPLMNSSVDGEKIIIKKDINIGIAVALNDGNLIVPVLKHADRYNIAGLTKAYNDLIRKTKAGKLTADDLSDGTYTISNIGGFGNVMGTPILVQPQVGIVAMGAIQKKPYIVETAQGDTIGIRHILMISHSYDHRIIDGALGGSFAKRIADYLEKFDADRKIS